MIITVQTGYIQLHIENHEFKQFGKARIEEFIGGLKMAIPGYDREYDPDTYIWTIKDLPAYRRVIEELKDFYFTDENQIEIFEER